MSKKRIELMMELAVRRAYVEWEEIRIKDMEKSLDESYMVIAKFRLSIIHIERKLKELEND